MRQLPKFINLLKHAVNVAPFRSYATLFAKEFEVTQFCKVDVKCPFNIAISPLDVFHGQDRVKITLESEKYDLPRVHCEQIGDTVVIEGSGNLADYVLKIETSVKASLKVTSEGGNVDVGSFHGKFIDLITSTGNVTLARSQCEKISISTTGGDITCKDIIQAGDIRLATTKSGSIKTDRIQGLRLSMTTTGGDIRTGSSYCDHSSFVTDFGHLTLNNVHKHVTIGINHEGMLNLAGFDGALNAYIKKGLVDLQISRLNSGESSIHLEESGTLIIRISELCLQTTSVDISSKDCVIGKDVKSNVEKHKSGFQLKPSGSSDANLTIDCKNGHVLLDMSSWSDMFKFSLKNKLI